MSTPGIAVSWFKVFLPAEALVAAGAYTTAVLTDAAWEAMPLIIVAAGTLIAAIASAVGVFVGLRTKAQADVIAGHVNSEKTAAQGRETALKVERDLLREMLEDKNKTADLLAQATSNQAIVAAAAPAAAAPVTAPVLDKIEENTEETANNTARTEATVQELKDDAK